MSLTIVSYIVNLFISKIFMRYSKTNTTWFNSINSWSLCVGCVRLLPSASRREEVSRIQHLGTSNFYYFPQYHVVFVYYLLYNLVGWTIKFIFLKITFSLSLVISFSPPLTSLNFRIASVYISSTYYIK